MVTATLRRIENIFFKLFQISLQKIAHIVYWNRRIQMRKPICLKRSIILAHKFTKSQNGHQYSKKVSVELNISCHVHSCFCSLPYINYNFRFWCFSSSCKSHDPEWNARWQQSLHHTPWKTDQKTLRVLFSGSLLYLPILLKCLAQWQSQTRIMLKFSYFFVSCNL